MSTYAERLHAAIAETVEPEAAAEADRRAIEDRDIAERRAAEDADRADERGRGDELAARLRAAIPGV